MDHDIVANDNSLKVAEGIVGKKWDFKMQKPPINPAKKVLYDDGPKLDGDIVDSRTNLKNTETKMSHKLVLDHNDIQTEEQSGSDPICSSAGCTQYKHKHKKLPYAVDYPVPNFGVDKDILDNHADLKIAEGIVGKKWDFKMQKPPINPAKKVLYDDGPKLDGDIVDSRQNLKDTEVKLSHKFVLDSDDVQLDAKLNTESDPICNSAGCTQYLHKHKKLPYPIDYPVPNFGVDRDIVDNHDDLKVAEGIVGHHWNFEFIKPPVNPAKKTVYDGAPPLDEDIIDSRKNLKDTEVKLSHKFTLDTDDVQLASDIKMGSESDPICNSAGCTQYLHKHKKLPYPIDYPVPDFGVDRDIIDNHDDLKVAEGIVGHKWNFILEKPPINPAKKTVYDGAPPLDEDIIDSRKNLKDTEVKLSHKFTLDTDDVQLAADIKTGSDPICSSAGC